MSSTAVPPDSRTTSGEKSVSRDSGHHRSTFARRPDFRTGAGAGGSTAPRREDPRRRAARTLGVALWPDGVADPRADTDGAPIARRARAGGNRVVLGTRGVFSAC